MPSTPYRIGFGDEDSSFIRTFYDFMLAIDGEQKIYSWNLHSIRREAIVDSVLISAHSSAISMPLSL